MQQILLRSIQIPPDIATKVNLTLAVHFILISTRTAEDHHLPTGSHIASCINLNSGDVTLYLMLIDQPILETQEPSNIWALLLKL